MNSNAHLKFFKAIKFNIEILTFKKLTFVNGPKLNVHAQPWNQVLWPSRL